MAPTNGDGNDHNDGLLNLSLSTLTSADDPPTSINDSPPPQNSNNLQMDNHQDIGLPSLPSLFPLPPQLFLPYPSSMDTSVGPSRRRHRVQRRSTNQVLRPGKPEIIAPPYPWATNKRATIHSLHYLRMKNITTVTGKVQCKRCARQFEIEYDLHQKLAELRAFIVKNRDEMRHRAPEKWMNPTLPDCKFCHQSNCLKPVPTKKKSINWLFLLLGQMLGCCKLSELKYFCKHTKNHRTGAKDRVLYLTYFELCRQLHPP